MVRDPITHNLVGGVRPPWVAVPAAAYMTEAETRCGLLYDTKIRFSAAKLRSLYGDYGRYVRRFEAARAASIKERFLLPEDVDIVKPIAVAGDFHERPSQ